MDDYSSLGSNDYSEEPEYGEIEAWLVLLCSHQKKKNLKNLKLNFDASVAKSISELFYFEPEADGIEWGFVSRWKNGLNLDQPYIEGLILVRTSKLSIYEIPLMTEDPN